ncbi:MAG: zf-HC2 domain-containing protein [Anaerolineae bacterium]|nr:zf-HC2 domain-containing protein [Anaerolineae bacterium]
MDKLTGGAKRERERLDELLSAYLDGQLSEEARAQLEARLAGDAQLQSELEALRRTVAMVRDLPRIPVPRNFLLPQTIAADKRRVAAARFRAAGFAPWLRAAAALVGLFLVITVAGALLYLGVPRMAATPPPREAWPVQVTAVVERTILAEEIAVTPEALQPAPEEAPMLLVVPQTETPLPAPKIPESTTQVPTTDTGMRAAFATPATLPTPTSLAAAAAPGPQPVPDTGELEQAPRYVPEHERTPVSRWAIPLLWIAASIGVLALATVAFLYFRRRR